MSAGGITASAGRYEAEIRRTTAGVPHVRADSWGSLGFGQGWASAADHIGTIADQVLKVRGERARFLGAGPNGAHVDSDLGYMALGLRERAPRTLEAQPPAVRELVEGYAAGVNAWLAQAGPDDMPVWCSGAEWVRALDAADLTACYADLALAASGRNFVRFVACARPPGPDGPAPTPPLEEIATFASNGFAIGAARSASGNAMVMANPHFPWFGEARFWECHLTIPGELDVYGATLVGAPGVLIGFNRNVAWTHTFSMGNRFTLYRLTLVPGEPTRYRYGDEEREMEPVEHAVGVRGADGSVTDVRRTLWKSHHGWVVNLPLFGWTDDIAIAFRDANDCNDDFLAQFLAMDRATSLDELADAHRRHNGMPWANTLAADRSGKVWYIDASRTPNISDAGIAWFTDRLASDPLTQLLHRNRIPLLDGSDPACAWVDGAGSPAPGLVPFDRLPQMHRDDWVMNANDSHYLTNPASPLTGYSPFHGLEIAPSARTRACLSLMAEPGSGPGGTLSADDVLGRVLSNRSVLADELVDAVVGRCRAAASVTVAERTIDVAAAAEILAAWDRNYDLDSVGALLWRETMAAFEDRQLGASGPLFAHDFRLAPPYRMPPELAEAPGGQVDPIVAALGAAVVTLESAGLAPDTPLGSAQFVARGGARIPMHGGQTVDGVANVLTPVSGIPSSSLEPLEGAEMDGAAIGARTTRTGIRDGGYRIVYGTSFVMLVELTAGGPRAQGLLAYGESENPASPHHDDQLEALAAKRLRPLLFTEEEIAGDPALEVAIVTG